jgi:hypothetical protein
MPISIIVLRSMLGFSPSEWACIAAQQTGVEVTQGFARTLDRKIRMTPAAPLTVRGETAVRLKALIEVACDLPTRGAPEVEQDKIHRLNKADTKGGIEAVGNMAAMGVPYAMLLYERFLGRPFSSHRDSVSELVGDSLESAIEELLALSGISFRKTKRAERLEGFDQAPDFMIPSEFNPQVYSFSLKSYLHGCPRMDGAAHSSSQGGPPGCRRQEAGLLCFAPRQQVAWVTHKNETFHP